MNKSNSIKFLAMPVSAILLVVALAAPVSLAPTAEAASLAEISEQLAEVAERVTPAVVRIDSTETARVRVMNPRDMMPDFFFGPWGRPDREEDQGQSEPRFREYERTGIGSGVIVDPEGIILTNYHVAGEAEELVIKLLDGREYEGEVLGGDRGADIAVVKIQSDEGNFPSAELGDSNDVRVGNIVLAIGSSFGDLSQTVTQGIISAKSRGGLGILPIADFIQTDAAINQGNSGGPLVNINGEVIGINTAIISQGVKAYQGVGLTIPINLAESIMEDILETGEVVYAFLGVEPQDVGYDTAQKFGLEEVRGALVARVIPGTPAEDAGFEEGDVITEFNGIEIQHADHLRAVVGRTEVDDRVEAKVIRDGKERTIPVRLAERDQIVAELGLERAPEEPAEETNLGVTVQDLTEEMAERFGFEDEQGVLVSNVVPGSPAADAGLEQGMLIVEVEREPVTSTAEFREAVEQAREEGEKGVLLLLRTETGTRYVVVNFQDDED